jgi:hypothetical protein
VAAAKLRNSFWKITDRFRVLATERTYRRKGGVRGGLGGPHHPLARPGGGAPPLGVVSPWPSFGSLLVFVMRPGNLEGSGFVSSDSENISCVAFLKHKKNSRKQRTGTMASRQ